MTGDPELVCWVGIVSATAWENFMLWYMHAVAFNSMNLFSSALSVWVNSDMSSVEQLSFFSALRHAGSYLEGTATRMEGHLSSSPFYSLYTVPSLLLSVHFLLLMFLVKTKSNSASRLILQMSSD